MKKQPRRLTLCKDTLRLLQDATLRAPQLKEAFGATARDTNCSHCFTMCGSFNNCC